MVKRPEDYRNEIDFIQDHISKYFPIYKTEVEFDVVSVYIKAPKGEDLEDKFDDLRNEFVPQNYIPHLIERHGEHMIKVKKQEEKTFKGVKVNIAMLFITLGTTLIAGAWWWSNYDPVGQGMLSLHNLMNGALYFTLPLLLILGTHEMGHYFMARYHNIKASLPFFLPMAPPLGTIGAFISIREPIPDKKSLLDVGIAGPIAGFVVAIPVTLAGLYLGDVMTPTATPPVEGIRQIWNFPVIIRGMTRVMPWTGGEIIHPTLFAGWVGFLVTGLNLLPASQLDGGHVVRSLFGEKAKYVSYAAFAFLIIVGIWQYIGWVVFAFLILFLGGVKHPPPLNDISKLDKKRLVVGGVAILILFISFHPIPVEQEQFSYSFDIDLEEDPEQELILGESFNYTLTVENKARNVDIPEGIEYEVNYNLSNEGWEACLWTQEDENWSKVNDPDNLTLDKGEEQSYRLEISSTENSSMENRITFTVKMKEPVQQKKERTMKTKIGDEFDIDLIESFSLIEENQTDFDFSIVNKGQNDTFNISMKDISDDNWIVDFKSENITNFNHEEIELGYAESVNITATLRLNETDPEPEGNLTVITTKISIRSENTGEEKILELVGIKVNEK
ncbi:MAG: site-2 protease family protein [Candidatus Thermoplasmatota archaeon]|nr:site-2 protease family protein [Candidatus Thermoplasmatota archaeon]MBS3789599.1 site-2 protease family protein [Candidatus Thermoplasmatota archaeon]